MQLKGNPNPQQTYGQYKIRRISYNKYGDVMGISIPKHVAILFENVKFSIEVSGNAITLISGLDLAKFKEEAHRYQLDDIQLN